MNAAHRVWRLGADVDTDVLAPVHQRLRERYPSIRRLILIPGDVIVAGPNFGIGSSREQAASALIKLGIAAVIAPSYGGLYFRNAFNVGLLLLTCPQGMLRCTP